MKIKTCLFCTGILLLATSAFAKIYNFPINPPREIDFKTDKEIFSVRKKMIAKYPVLYPKEYTPRVSSLFQQIEEGKPWWGLKGLLCYGPGELSIEGESDETRFIDNPFLLIGLEEGFAVSVMKKKGNCPLSYPKPTKIQFDQEKKAFSVAYSVSSHDRTIKNLSANNHRNPPSMSYSFNGKNAVDLAMPCAYAVKVKNIQFLDENNISKGVYCFKDFIHVGGSCGYSGGCNNGSPRQKETEFRIERYPASIKFKMWKETPKSVEDPADLTYEIKIN